MEEEIKDRFEKIEKKLDNKHKDIWDKIQSLSGVLIPIAIAGVGWYYTNENSKSQLEAQRLNDENQFQIALVNSNVGQSELIKDFMQHLVSKDTATRNIAIEAILYAAPTPGKKIVEVLSRTGDKQTRLVAIDALANKRTDLISNLFSDQKQIRLIAANEIITNWTNDRLILSELLSRTKECISNSDSSPNCDDGVYNSFAVLPSFSKSLLLENKPIIVAIENNVPPNRTKTKKLANDLIKQL
ncbi:hypothetical protein ACFS7Z_21015 [Pontibacter toksunensis]|uniref:HEAT repeat protein n=1 Tax=Pontibacter toksunensis TaxID=1332631 RepID=A0ABW6C0U0_9BACT